MNSMTNEILKMSKLLPYPVWFLIKHAFLQEKYNFRGGVENLMQFKSFVSPTKCKHWLRSNIKRYPRMILQLREGLFAKNISVTVTKRNGESSADNLARRKQAALFCEFVISKPEVSYIWLG